LLSWWPWRWIPKKWLDGLHLQKREETQKHTLSLRSDKFDVVGRKQAVLAAHSAAPPPFVNLKNIE
jgi:hypothetical protein